MPIKLGSTGLGAIYNGSNKIAKIYKGSDLVYQSVSYDPNVVALIERTITNVTADMIGNITSIGAYSLQECDNLNNIQIPEGITIIDTMSFYGCSSLINIILPSSITTIGMSAFSNCENLKEMTILASTPPTLSYDGISTSTTKIYVPSSSVSTYQTASMWADLTTRATNPVTFVGI